MNWTKFKAAILPDLQDLLTAKDPTEFSWIPSKGSGLAWYWDGEGNWCDYQIEQALTQLDPEFRQEILKCDYWNNYSNLNEDKQVSSILTEITWRIINDFTYLFAAFQDQIQAQQELDDFDNNQDEPQREDYDDDEDGLQEFENAYDDWEIEQSHLKSQLKKATQVYNDLWVEFNQIWNRLELSAFYNKKYQNTAKERSQ